MEGLIMEKAEQDRLHILLRIISQSPELGYFVSKGPPPGLSGCVRLSSYLTDLALKIKDTGTADQWRRLNELAEAYRDIFEDLNEAYLLYLMYENMKRLLRNEKLESETLRRQVEYLIAENEKLKKTLNFEGQ